MQDPENDGATHDGYQIGKYVQSFDDDKIVDASLHANTKAELGPVVAGNGYADPLNKYHISEELANKSPFDARCSRYGAFYSLAVPLLTLVPLGMFINGQTARDRLVILAEDFVDPADPPANAAAAIQLLLSLLPTAACITAEMITYMHPQFNCAFLKVTMDSRGCFDSLVCQRIWQTAGKSRLAVYPFAREFARDIWQ
jgi:hypothetical protein